MKTIEKAHEIVRLSPDEAMSDAIGLAAMALVIFGVFLSPAFF